MSEIYLRKEHLEKILDVAKQIGPTDDWVLISEDNSSGIGQVVTAEFDVVLNGVKGKFKKVIVDHNDW